MNIFKQLWVSLYSPKDIASFQNQGIGKTILYVFFVSLIAFLPSAYYFGTMMVDGLDAMHETVSEDLPQFEIKNGTLTTENGEPFTMNKNGYQIFVDGTGTLTPEKVAAKSDEAVALLKSDLVFVSGGNVQSSPYSLLEGDNQKISTWLDSVESVLPIILPLLLLILYLFTASGIFIKVTILAAFGLLFKSALGRSTSYRHLWRIGAYSITLTTIFFTIMDSFQATVPFASLISWFVTLMMLYLSIKETSANKKLD
ncbi:hypothetical protein SRABI96_05279 [Peribacillus sp. Bi96]|uniref:DUF1189 domain-containing protein n=1 Tax=unclassified Peribacillus TaxID=2675266 RepID=UPI001D5AD29B|nr:DUF1189 domain-containing protein [Peribacillus sp. Bi96]CAH0317228.1 hypothetical protein SRABI96_05279 [Peribacillus sp. Bi96]